MASNGYTALIALNDSMFSTVFFLILMNVSFVFVDTNYWQFHYGLIKFNGCWYFYDGAMTPHPRLFPVTDLPKESIPSYCLYILESDVP